MKRTVAIRLLLAFVIVVGGNAAWAGAASGVGSPLYPDLWTQPPEDLSFDTVEFADGTTHEVLRLKNTVWNAGPGRLELEGRSRGKVYQRFYDAPKGGTYVTRTGGSQSSVTACQRYRVGAHGMRPARGTRSCP